MQAMHPHLTCLEALVTWKRLTWVHRQLQLGHAHAHGEVSCLAALQHHVLLSPRVSCKEALLPLYGPHLTPSKTLMH